jgi:hypothetical protein
MKYVRTAGFLLDLRRLPPEHRKLFVAAVHQLLRPALDAGAHTGATAWPRALRIHKIGANSPSDRPRQLGCSCQVPGLDGRPALEVAGVIVIAQH